MSASFEELLDKNLNTVTMKPGSLLTGIVIDILETHVIVHVGLKSEAAVVIQEFVNEKGEIDLKQGMRFNFIQKPLKMDMEILESLEKRLLNKKSGKELKIV